MKVDVLCLGHASYDMIFTVDHHFEPDEKGFATGFFECGGGPAANAAVAVSRLGLKSAFIGFLGKDVFGDKHFAELRNENVNTDLIQRGLEPTPLSCITVKPNGQRSVMNHRVSFEMLTDLRVDLLTLRPKVILLDGHEWTVSIPVVEQARILNIPVILDAGSQHEGTNALVPLVDYVVASKRFAEQYTGEEDMEVALNTLSERFISVVITLGENGLIWKNENERGSMPAFQVNTVDTTGAGDAFHGAFAAGMAEGMSWESILKFSSAAGALCCTVLGARHGLAYRHDVDRLLSKASR
jgi:sulfofructose kinase